MEHISCNLCKNNNSYTFITKNNFTIVKCNDCELVYVNPRLARKEIFSRYSPDYFQKEYLPYLENNQESILQNYKGVLSYINQNLRTASKRMIEIGCGTGFFLSLAKQDGFEVTGMEYNQKMIEYGKEKFGLEIKQSDIHGEELPSSSYEVVILLDVIEHLFDPFYVLIQSYKTLANDGLVFISTPNIESEFFRQQGAEWNMIGPNEHLYYFSKTTIDKMLKKVGFKEVLIHHGNEDFKDVLYVLARK